MNHHHHIEGVTAYVVGCEEGDRCPGVQGGKVMGVTGWVDILDACTDPDCEYGK